jgi:uncharacterized protein
VEAGAAFSEKSDMEIAGYIAAVLIGISLGLIGGGGSVLTVPLLFYVFGLDVVSATAWSLFIVGVTSGIGSVAYIRRNEIHLTTAVIFGIPSIAAVFATRAWIIPALPDTLFSFGETEITKDLSLLVLFAVLMLATSYSMIRNKNVQSAHVSKVQGLNYPMIFLEGIVVGTLTGLVGAGGGFLIVPALVLLSRLPMKQAVGTSLVIIAAKSLVGFTAEAGSISGDWPLLLTITACAIAGVFTGAAISKRVDGNKLKPLFGWFILSMGLFILVREGLRLSLLM